MKIREATEKDWDSIWPIFHQIVKSEDTYGYDTDTSKDQAKEIWLNKPRKTYIFLENNQVLGTYYLNTNYAGPGSHVCNCGYMVTSLARGKGVATRMCEHSQKIAIELGYKAMQFNFVASSNEGAIKLWNKLGFETLTRLPKAFNHPNKGYIDALVMYKWLQ
ncbi:MAG: GNAT family N-acetyltransferase [Kangiellaceae bacterium]